MKGLMIMPAVGFIAFFYCFNQPPVLATSTGVSLDSVHIPVNYAFGIKPHAKINFDLAVA
jgi:hypothetical protein